MRRPSSPTDLGTRKETSHQRQTRVTHRCAPETCTGLTNTETLGNWTGQAPTSVLSARAKSTTARHGGPDSHPTPDEGHPVRTTDHLIEAVHGLLLVIHRLPDSAEAEGTGRSPIRNLGTRSVPSVNG